MLARQLAYITYVKGSMSTLQILLFLYFYGFMPPTLSREEPLKKALNNIEGSDPIFAHLFDDVDLYSTRLGVGDTKQNTTISDLVKVIDQADLLHAEGDVLGNAYEYLIGEFASETGKRLVNSIRLQGRLRS